jgi:predicted RNA binding protein YcfA (HicA-like mRNA interferase family)
LARIEKLYARAVRQPSGLSFDDLLALVRAAGFVFRRQSGDHMIFVHPRLGRDGFLNLQPRHGEAKAYQVRQVVAKIDDYGLLEA